MNRKPVTKEAALLKMAALCARSEQCTFDISRKLSTMGLGGEAVEEILAELVERGFLDEARFARSFARDKVRFSGWGRHKIRAALAAKRITGAAADAALAAIEPQDYADAIARAAASKARSLDLGQRDDRLKLYRHILSRGFESDLAMNEIRKLLK